MNLTHSPAWQKLQSLATQPCGVISPRAVTVGDIQLDFTRQPLDAPRWQALLDLAAQENVTAAVARLFSGAIVNGSENRAATHWALRQKPLQGDLAAVDEKMAALVEKVRADQSVKTIVNIGIGGSDLGPRLAVEALRDYGSNNLTIHFIANIDGAEARDVLRQCKADETLFIIASKSFGTLETLENAKTCRAWLQQELGDKADIAKHFMAVTSNVAAASAFGIAPENCFGFPDSIGGRYSLWGPVGLVVRLAIGNENFARLLKGAAMVDEHFQQAPLAENAPVLMALTSLWHNNFAGTRAEAVLPYSHRLSLLPAFLQQLVMESNGKNVTADGAAVTHATAPVIFGAAGTVGQHSFYQLLHQGTQVIPADILVMENTHDEAQRWLLANGLAQADALWHGTHDETLPAHRRCAGKKPVVLMRVPSITPSILGQLLALYEHKTFAQSVLWRINAFDQWGVELGKKLAQTRFEKLA